MYRKVFLQKYFIEFVISLSLQAKLAFERLQIPHIYHPFICGPNNSLVDKLREETGAKIHIPPSVLNKDEIVVSGDKDGVMRAKDTIMKIYQEKVGPPALQISLTACTVHTNPFYEHAAFSLHSHDQRSLIVFHFATKNDIL